jgi:Gluconate 2-dehydrogenase subunit 3
VAGWSGSMNVRKAGTLGAMIPVISRRKWLQSLAIGGAVSALGGTIALVRWCGYDVDAVTEAKLRVLAPWQYVVVRDVARRMVAPDRSEGVPTPDEVGVAQFVDHYLMDLRPALRRDVLRMLRYVEQLAPLGSGFVHRFTALSAADQDRVLGALEASQSDLLRASFQALKGLVMMGYYRDPKTFGILGYRGPLLAMPDKGNP